MAKLLNMLITLPVIILPVAALAIEAGRGRDGLADRGPANSRKKRCRKRQMRCFDGIRAHRTEAIRSARRNCRRPALWGRTKPTPRSCPGALPAKPSAAPGRQRPRYMTPSTPPGSRWRRRMAAAGRRPRFSRKAGRCASPIRRAGNFGARACQAPRGSLGRFQKVSTAYFIEKRCRFLPYSQGA